MNKKIMSLMLTLAMVISLVSGMSIIASAGGATPLAGDEDVLKSGSYVLNGDVVFKKSLQVSTGAEVTIDLNGYVLTNEYSILLKNNGTLTIKDSSAKATPHYFEFVKDGAWKYIAEPDKQQTAAAVTVDKIDSSTTVVVIYGGVITSMPDKKTSTGIHNTVGSTLTIEKANIVGVNCYWGSPVHNEGKVIIKKANFFGNASTEGGALRNINGTAIIGEVGGNNSDVLFKYNVATVYAGGAILNYTVSYSENKPDLKAEMTINCCTITNNRSLKTSGGAICNYLSKSTGGESVITINDCIISNNISASGGGISNHEDENSLSGVAKVIINGGIISGNRQDGRFVRNTSGNGTYIRNDLDELHDKLSNIVKLFFNYKAVEMFSIGKFLTKLTDVISNIFTDF